MPSREQAKAIAIHLNGLSGGPVVTRKAAARQLAQLDPTDANELLQELISLARDGHEPTRCVLYAVVAALDQEQESIPYASELKRLAHLQELRQVAALFASGAQQEMDARAAAKADSLVLTNSLGFMKSRARMTRNPDELARLSTVANPQVMRNVLLNPRLTEELVVRIAARRPARPEPLMEVWRSKWSTRGAVRRALAFNPYLPLEIGSKLLPLLNDRDLEELSRVAELHPALRDQAQVLLLGKKK
jgi:hypothetical protein